MILAANKHKLLYKVLVVAIVCLFTINTTAFGVDLRPNMRTLSAPSSFNNITFSINGFDPLSGYSLGASMGGTKLSLVLYTTDTDGSSSIIAKKKYLWRDLLKAEDGEDLTDKKRFPPDSVADVIAVEVRDFLKEHGLNASDLNNLGIASTGMVNDEEETLGDPYELSFLPFEKYKFVAEMSQRLGVERIELKQDSHAAVDGEILAGLLRDLRNGFYIIQGTGFGGSLMVNGKYSNKIAELIEPGYHIVGRPIPGELNRYEYRFVQQNGKNDLTPGTSKEARERLIAGKNAKEDFLWESEGERIVENILSGTALESLLADKEALVNMFGGEESDYSGMDLPRDLSEIAVNGEGIEKDLAAKIIRYFAEETGKAIAVVAKASYGEDWQLERVVIGSSLGEKLGKDKTGNILLTEDDQDYYLYHIRKAARKGLREVSEEYAEELSTNIFRSEIDQDLRETIGFCRTPGSDDLFQTKVELLLGMHMLRGGSTFSEVNGMLIEKQGEGPGRGKNVIEFLPGIERGSKGKSLKAKFIRKGVPNTVLELTCLQDTEKVYTPEPINKQPVSEIEEHQTHFDAVVLERRSRNMLEHAKDAAKNRRIKRFLERDFNEFMRCVVRKDLTDREMMEKRIELAQKGEEMIPRFSELLRLFEIISSDEVDPAEERKVDQEIEKINSELFFRHNINFRFFSERVERHNIIIPMHILDYKKGILEEPDVNVFYVSFIKNTPFIKPHAGTYFQNTLTIEILPRHGVKYQALAAVNALWGRGMYDPFGRLSYNTGILLAITDILIAFVTRLLLTRYSSEERITLLEKIVQGNGLFASMFEKILNSLKNRNRIAIDRERNVPYKHLEMLAAKKDFKWYHSYGHITDLCRQNVEIHELGHYKHLAECDLDKLNKLRPIDSRCLSESAAILYSIAYGPAPFWETALVFSYIHRLDRPIAMPELANVLAILAEYLSIENDIPEYDQYLSEGGGWSEESSLEYKEKALKAGEHILREILEFSTEDLRAAAEWGFNRMLAELPANKDESNDPAPEEEEDTLSERIGSPLILINTASQGYAEGKILKNTPEVRYNLNMIASQNKTEQYIMTRASRYLKNTPVNMHIDLTPIGAGENDQIIENMRTLAQLIRWHNKFGLDVRYMLENDPSGDALKILKEFLLKSNSGLAERVGKLHAEDKAIDIHLEDLDRIGHDRIIRDREYIVALKDTSPEGIVIPNYTSAAAIGLALAALRAQGEGSSENAQQDEKNDLFKEKMLDKIRDIYARYMIISELEEFSAKELELMVYGCSETKLYFTRLYALPPAAKVSENIEAFHEMMRNVLIAA